MNENRIEGNIDQLTGQVQDNVGGLFGDTKSQAEGKARNVYGMAEELTGRATDQAQTMVQNLGELVRERPLTSVIIGIGVGWLVGFALTRR